ncbi:MAG: DUF3598 family protein [Coleofasciculus sp. C1-SOL-03]|uniref:hypothetical protein n=1 Tax=Coleofasciculus sp. C1-SOL-03 TaxID=3069522 RepID=UPI0032F0CF12
MSKTANEAQLQNWYNFCHYHANADWYGTWIGCQKTITPDWIVSAAIATSWKPIEQLIEDYLTLHLPNNVSISYPESIESGQEFLFVVDWLASPTVLHRGICHYDASGFTRFTLEVFSNGE